MQLREYFRRYFHEQSFWDAPITVIAGRRGPKRPKLVKHWVTRTITGEYTQMGVDVREGWLKARYPLSCAVARLSGTPLEDMDIHPKELPVI